MSSPELASQELGSPRIRDFANRVLYVVADRLSTDGGDVSSTYQVSGEGGDFSLHFRAEYAEGSRIFEYNVSLGYREPLGSEWEHDAVRRLFRLDADDDSNVLYVDTAGQEVDDPEDAVAIAYEGSVSAEYEYTFTVPVGNRLACAAKMMSYVFLDVDDCEIDAQVGYHESARQEPVIVDDELEAMWGEGPAYVDMGDYEVGLSRVTVGDLEMILDSLQRIGLISKNAVVLSKRLPG